jgi:hypothetical protein
LLTTNNNKINNKTVQQTLTQSVTHGKTGSLINVIPQQNKTQSTILPEEQTQIGFAIKQGGITKAACYKVRNGVARLMGASCGNLPFIVNRAEQASINWATAALPLPHGSYIAPNGGSCIQGRKGVVNKATMPVKNLATLTQELFRQPPRDNKLELFGLDSAVQEKTDGCDKVTLKLGKMKACLFTRFLTTLYGPSPETAGLFKNIMNSLRFTDDQTLKMNLVKLYNCVEEHVDKGVSFSTSLVRSKNFNAARQRDKLLKIVSFLPELAGLDDQSFIELYKVNNTKEQIPLISVVEINYPVVVSKSDVGENFCFPSTWTKSPFEVSQKGESETF